VTNDHDQPELNQSEASPTVDPARAESSGAALTEYHLKVFANRSELTLGNGSKTEFVEGASSPETRLRYKRITDALAGGFLKDQIRLCREEPEKLMLRRLAEEHQALLDGLVDSMTSEVGRALLGLSVMQITIKAIEPAQSIRLHKGGNSSKDFGWRDGISMRSLDKGYITPVLRAEGLLKLNADGFMMTRTLAENYPYTRVYKAAMRGAREEWIALVEGLETGAIQALPALHYLISKLLNNAARFRELAADTLRALREFIRAGHAETPKAVTALVRRHMDASSYAARIMEIAMHALMQALLEVGALGSSTLVPMSQMRSANKKHGNIGDIELMDGGNIIESWDAKYGKPYLRDELEELNDKLELHEEVMVAGFVTSEQPLLQEMTERIEELLELRGVAVGILTLEQWVAEQVDRGAAVEATEQEIARRWLTAYTESLAQEPTRQALAPIDEPCFEWLTALRDLMWHDLEDGSRC
jgi:hypothetical protein